MIFELIDKLSYKALVYGVVKCPDSHLVYLFQLVYKKYFCQMAKIQEFLEAYESLELDYQVRLERKLCDKLNLDQLVLSSCFVSGEKNLRKKLEEQLLLSEGLKYSIFEKQDGRDETEKILRRLKTEIA